jgi:hypothetical protein
VRQIFDALLGAIALINVDARVRVSDGFGILGHGASVYDVPCDVRQGKNLEIVARWRVRKVVTAEYAESTEKILFLDFCLLGDLCVLCGERSCSSLLGTNPQLFLDSPFIRFASAIYSTQFPHRTHRRSTHG